MEAEELSKAKALRFLAQNRYSDRVSAGVVDNGKGGLLTMA